MVPGSNNFTIIEIWNKIVIFRPQAFHIVECIDQHKLKKVNIPLNSFYPLVNINPVENLSHQFCKYICVLWT